MNKMMTIAAVAMMASTSAMAGDWDNTAVKMTAVSDDYSISVKTPETGATEFALGGTHFGADLTATWKRNGAVDNYAVKAGKTVDVMGPVYAGASTEFTWGDSTTSDTNTLTVNPFVGVSMTAGKVTPYAELGYAIKSVQKDLFDMSRDSSYVEVGASYAMSEAVSVKLSVVEARDINFKNAGDRNAEVGFTFKF
jgi:hypothetical protein